MTVTGFRGFQDDIAEIGPNSYARSPGSRLSTLDIGMLAILRLPSAEDSLRAGFGRLRQVVGLCVTSIWLHRFRRDTGELSWADNGSPNTTVL